MISSLQETDWAYIAGLVDADGYISLMQNGPRMGVTNQHQPTIQWLLMSLGGNINGSEKGGFDSKKKCSQWNCTSGGMRIILPRLLPYLRIKKDRALLMLEYLYLPRGAHTRKEEILAEVRRLNAGCNGKGKSIHNRPGV